MLKYADYVGGKKVVHGCVIIDGLPMKIKNSGKGGR
jgi:hypothetical protein